MTVEELLQLPTIKGLKLISGNLGIHREISTVTVVDTPDGFQWLKGNEVVITTTYALEKTPNAFLDFISKLLSRNISALIVKSDRYIKVIPENAKKLCDEKALPLIYCPAIYAFCRHYQSNPVRNYIQTGGAAKRIFQDSREFPGTGNK